MFLNSWDITPGLPPKTPISASDSQVVASITTLGGLEFMNIFAGVMTFPGWWYTYPSEKYEFVSWDDYSQYMEK